MKGILDRLAAPIPVLVLLFLMLGFECAIYLNANHLSELTGGYGILDMDFGFSAERVRTVFAAYDVNGWPLWRYIAILDAFYPLAYGLFIAALIHRFGGPIFLSALPIGSMISDCVENFCIWKLTESWPDPTDQLIHVTSMANVSKFILLCLSVLAAIYLVSRFWLTNKTINVD